MVRLHGVKHRRGFPTANEVERGEARHLLHCRVLEERRKGYYRVLRLVLNDDVVNNMWAMVLLRRSVSPLFVSGAPLFCDKTCDSGE